MNYRSGFAVSTSGPDQLVAQISRFLQKLPYSMSTDISSTDKKITGLLRSEGPLSVNELVESLGITATAVRQKLNRLTAAGMVARANENSGRGRPIHLYSMTEKGIRAAGNNLDDLARVLWEEVNKIPDVTIRNHVVDSVVVRLTEMYRHSVEGASADERLRSIAKLFAQKEIPFETKLENGKTVLQIIGCPYPDLDDAEHSICNMEKKLLSGLVNQELQVDHASCGCSGSSCTFQASSDSLEQQEKGFDPMHSSSK